MTKKKITDYKDIRFDPNNANKHTKRGMGLLEQSLQSFGAGRSAVVARDGTVIAGNATLETAAQLGIPIQVVETDGKTLIVVQRTDLPPDSPQARGLSIADNRVAQVNLDWNTNILMEERKRGDAIDKMFHQSELVSLGAVGAMMNPTPLAPLSAADPIMGEAATLREAPNMQMENVPSELPGVRSLKDEIVFPSSNWMGIPDLRPDRLVEKLPKPLDTWGNRAITPDDGITTWIYNFGTVSPVGIPWDRTILGFYAWDEKFECWWTDPATYTGRLMNAGVTQAIMPDYSLWPNDPLIVQAFNWFRSLWVGRYMQEAGIRIIPEPNWSTEKTFEFCFIGLPKEIPVMATTLQNVHRNDKEGLVRCMAGLKQIRNRWDPAEWLVTCTGDLGPNLMLEAGFGGTITRVEPTSEKRTSVRKQQKKAEAK